jgi:hypothetical protein
MSDPISIKWGDKEVVNPVARAALISAAVVVVAPLMLAMFAVVFALLALVALSLPFHFLLILCGRRGFLQRDPADGGPNYVVGAAGFRRAVPDQPASSRLH